MSDEKVAIDALSNIEGYEVDDSGEPHATMFSHRQMLDMFLAGVVHGRKSPTWVSTSERLPESGSNFTILIDGIKEFDAMYHPVKGWYINELATAYHELNVTHWRPLRAEPEA